MQGNLIPNALVLAGAGVLLAACDDGATSPARGVAPAAASVVGSQPLLAGFIVRARLEPFFINQMPELSMRSRVATDLIIQRLVANPGPGGWHTHSGPTFSIVDQGYVTITKHTKKDGCVSTTYGPGQSYFEEAGEVHRATVVGTQPAVEYKARFYMPPGGPLSTAAAAPPCAPR